MERIIAAVAVVFVIGVIVTGNGDDALATLDAGWDATYEWVSEAFGEAE